MTKVDVVSEVAFFPLKSAQAATVNGEVPKSLNVGETGFEVAGVRDRDWVLYDPNEGQFISQRGWGAAGQKVRFPQDTRLATVEVDVRDDHVSFISDVGQLEVASSLLEGLPAVLDIWGKDLPIVKQSKNVSAYFSRLLDREVESMRSDRSNTRWLPEKYQREGAFNQVAGADGHPFLLTSKASLQAALASNGMATDAVPINRFRGNIILQGNGLGPFGEDYIDGDVAFTIGEIGFWAVKACSRCPIPNIDQTSGERLGGATVALRGRAGTIFSGESGVFFGQNVIHGNLGSISVGDSVTVAKINEQPNITFRNAV